MNRAALFVTAMFLASGVLFTLRQAESQPAVAGSLKLRGARPAINAADYSSLQEAIDALPASGGVVKLPAGTFEISEPLRISQEDVLIEGSGTATHIKNVNTAG